MKDRLIAAMVDAIALRKSFYIKVKAAGCKHPEMIINPWENLEYKKEYYMFAYDNNLCLKDAPNIKIVEFGQIEGNF